MDALMSYLPDISSTYYHIFIGIGMLLLLYLNDVFNKNKISLTIDTNHIRYGYEENNGPSTWTEQYPGACGKRQSPININPSRTITIPAETSNSLKFSSGYYSMPYDMKLYNSGHTVVIYAHWCGDERPTVTGGPLTEPYKFLNMRFRWGQTVEEGSEHMIDSMRYAMELQVMFVKSACRSDDILIAARDGGLLIISYIFLATPIDNPYLEPIVSSLNCLKVPLSCIPIDPMPLTVLAPTFSRKYYTYIGSLTFPPCTQKVRWIVQPEPLAISPRQVRKFRKILGCNGLLVTNTRPVQRVNNRDIFYYD